MLFVNLKNKLRKKFNIDLEKKHWRFLYKLYHKINKLGRIKWFLGTEPDFIVIGMMKCGTTSLYNALAQHPNIHSALKKDIHYFDFYNNKSFSWYRSFFPLSISRFFYGKILRKKFITGEASSTYMFYHKDLPKKIKKKLPNIKLLAILRNPVERAYSNYQHVKLRGREPLSFEKALAEEKKRTKKNKYNQNIFDIAYLEKGFYYQQLKSWINVFKKENLLVIQTEAFKKNPEQEMKRMCAFLEIPYSKKITYPKLAIGKYDSPINKKTRAKLVKLYEKENNKLYELIGETFDWK